MAATATTASGLSYVGNPDYRGYLAAQAPSNPLAAAALGIVGNDGNYDPTKINSTAVVPYKPGSDASNSSLKDYITNSYNTYSSLANPASSGSANTDASDLAYLDSNDSALNGQLSSTQKALADGLTGLNDSFNESTNRTNQDKQTADTAFNGQRTSATKDKQTAIDSVNTGARSLSDSVRRILGLAGGANSSAYQIAAPEAIATDTTEKRTGVNDTYAKNYKSIDDSQSATDLRFQRAIQDLIDQRNQKESGLRSGVLQQEQGIESQLGQNALTRTQIKGGGAAATTAALAPSTAAINDRQSAIDNLFSQFRTPYTLADTTPVAANIGSYTDSTTPTTISDNGGAATGSSSDPTLSPYLLALQKKFAPTT